MKTITNVSEIKKQIESNNFEALSLSAEMGVGQIDSIKQLAEEMGVGYQYSNALSLCYPEDFTGLPVYVEEGQNSWSTPIFFHTNHEQTNNGESVGILVIDEYSSDISYYTKEAIDKIINEKSFNSHKITDSTIIVVREVEPFFS